MMTTQEIIQRADELKDSKQSWEKLYKAIYITVMAGTHRILRHGDTLMWLKLLPNDTAQMFLFNADTHKNMIRNLKECFKALDKAGFKKVFGDTENPQIIEIAKRMGYPVDVKPIGKNDKGQTIYRGTVNV